MQNVLDVIKKPMVTERATNLRADYNQYVFRVNPEASKSDVRRAVQELFKVTVLQVRTMNVRGKFRRMGNAPGANRPSWKKAIVTLKAGQEIKMVEEA